MLKPFKLCIQKPERRSINGVSKIASDFIRQLKELITFEILCRNYEPLLNTARPTAVNIYSNVNVTFEDEFSIDLNDHTECHLQ